MKKFTAIFAALLMICTFTAANALNETTAVTISLDANATTGFGWTGFVLGGESVVLDSAEGTYIVDPAPEDMVGIGGQTYFTLIPVKPGTSIVVFNYARPWEPETAQQCVVVAEVDESLHLYVTDVTDSGMVEGTVVSVDAEDHSAVLYSESHGEIVARFDANMELPVVDEQIVIYTNGTMTMSLPAIMNVIAWNTVPSDLARTDAK